MFHFFSVHLQCLNEEEKKMAKSQLEKCRVAEGASEEDIDKLLCKKHTYTHTDKCMLACALEQFTVVSK